MKSIKVFALIGVVFVWFTCSAPSCSFSHRKYYSDYDCEWVSDDPEIVLNNGCGSGKMIIDGVKYNFSTFMSNNATYIGFYIGDHEDLWVADTKLKKGKLYLTVTKDTISNYLGKTIVLYQRPVQSEE